MNGDAKRRRLPRPGANLPKFLWAGEEFIEAQLRGVAFHGVCLTALGKSDASHEVTLGPKRP
jgi:hypothetical protein